MVSIWRPRATPGWFSVGDIASLGVLPPAGAVVVRADATSCLVSKPVKFRVVHQDKTTGYVVWRPVARSGQVREDRVVGRPTRCERGRTDSIRSNVSIGCCHSDGEERIRVFISNDAEKPTLRMYIPGILLFFQKQQPNNSRTLSCIPWHHHGVHLVMWMSRFRLGISRAQRRRAEGSWRMRSDVSRLGRWSPGL